MRLNTVSLAWSVSPYLKSLSMVAANKLLHLLEAFSTPWFLFSVAQNHHLVFFLLEAFNNIIQYQFDGKPKLWNFYVCESSLSGFVHIPRPSLLRRKLQPGLRHHPQAECVPPAGQPALWPRFNPKGLAEEEEDAGYNFPHQLPGDCVHGGLSSCSTGRAWHTQGQSSRYTRCKKEVDTLKYSTYCRMIYFIRQKVAIWKFLFDVFFWSFCSSRLLSGIDKLTEKSQVSEDGTMVSVPKTDSPATAQSDQSAAGATSDTESNSGRDNEVNSFLFSAWISQNLRASLLNCFLSLNRTFSTRKLKWKEDVCRVPLQLRYGLRHQSGSVKYSAFCSVFD